MSTGESLQGNAAEPLTDEEETLLRRYYEVGFFAYGELKPAVHRCV